MRRTIGTNLFPCIAPCIFVAVNSSRCWLAYLGGKQTSKCHRSDPISINPDYIRNKRIAQFTYSRELFRYILSRRFAHDYSKLHQQPYVVHSTSTKHRWPLGVTKKLIFFSISSSDMPFLLESLTFGNALKNKAVHSLNSMRARLRPMQSEQYGCS